MTSKEKQQREAAKAKAQAEKIHAERMRELKRIMRAVDTDIRG